MPPAGSALLHDEYLATEDPRFLDELFACTNGKKLKSLADHWYGDARPFARRALLAYIDDGCDRPHHRPLVKALFKLAEIAEDDEVMGHFLVAFDRYCRRRVKEKRTWNYTLRTWQKTPALVPDPTVPERPAWGDVTKTPHFARRTRRYLCRRAFRYFRRVSKEDPARYGHAVRETIARYEDQHLQKPEQLLAAWGLIHILYWGSPVLDRDPRGIRVRYGRSLAELEPAPYCPKAWTDCFDALLELIARAQSRTVRVYCLSLLRRDYDPSKLALPASRVRALLRVPDEEVQTFAADLLRRAEGLHQLALSDWLDLLHTSSPAALPVLCELVQRHVSPDRLTLAQCVDLASSSAAPVASLGLDWTRKKSAPDDAALREIVRLARAEVPRIRQEGIAFALDLIERMNAPAEHLRELFDARHDDVRERALAFFARATRYRDDTLLWAALAESPHADVRAFFLRHLDARQSSFAPGTLRHVWVTALYGVHRGSRDKRAALRQIAERITARPAEADGLIPLFGIALRSVRAPERRAALAAVAQAAFREPALRASLAAALPELRFERAEAV